MADDVPSGLEHVAAAMIRLAARRPIFHSEADFQHAFAWQLQTDHPEAQIRLETRPQAGVRLDVLTTIGGRRRAYELKYLLRRITTTVSDELFDLPTHGAQDARRYDFIKDIVRLETLLASGAVDEGYAVALTNDPSYWQQGVRPEVSDAAFRLTDGRVLADVLSWAASTGPGTMKGREAPLPLNGVYELAWRDFSQVDGGRYGELRYVAVEVVRPSPEAAARSLR